MEELSYQNDCSNQKSWNMWYTYKVGRWLLIPLFYKDPPPPPILPTPTFFNVVYPLLFLLVYNLHPHCPFDCFVSLAGILVLWSDITHMQTHTTHSESNRLTQPYKYILTPPAMCSQQLSVLHWMNNSLISKIYFPQCLFVCGSRYICWLDAIRLSS